MSFLGRVAARANATPSVGGAVGATPGVALPAMASTSPLVAHDQRLTLPGFLATAPEALAPGAIGEIDASAAAPEGEPSGNVPSAGMGVEGGRIADAFVLPNPGRESPGHAFTAVPVAARSAPGIADGAELTPSNTLPRPHATNAFRGEAFVRSSPLPGATASLAPLSPAHWRASSEREPARGAEPTITVRDVVAVSSDPASGEQRTEVGPPPRAVLDAVARLDKWLRTDASDAGTPTPNDAHSTRTNVAPPAALVPAMNSVPHAEAAEGGNFSGGPVISIGKLEIEVVPPAPKARQESQRAPERRARGASRAPSAAAFSAPRSFGWRQR